MVEIQAKPNGLWHIVVNHTFAISIRNDGKKWEFYCEQGICITEAHMGYNIAMITD